MGTLYVVATPIGNLNDISKRVLEILTNADLIAAEDTRHTLKLLNFFQIKNKLVSYHKFNEKTKGEYIIENYLNKGKNVALVSDAGTPCISDPGYNIVKAARENGINVIGVSGPSAVITALSISGFEINSFAFYGFLPRENSKIQELFGNINDSDIKTFVIYESPKRIKKTVEILKNNFPNCKACFCQDLTKLHEKSFWGKIEDVAKEINEDEKSELGEYTIIVEKDEQKEILEESFAIEALLIDVIIKKNCSMKEAIKEVSTKYKINKNDVYESSLKLKSLGFNVKFFRKCQ